MRGLGLCDVPDVAHAARLANLVHISPLLRRLGAHPGELDLQLLEVAKACAMSINLSQTRVADQGNLISSRSTRFRKTASLRKLCPLVVRKDYNRFLAHVLWLGLRGPILGSQSRLWSSEVVCVGSLACQFSCILIDVPFALTNLTPRVDRLCPVPFLALRAEDTRWYATSLPSWRG